MNYFTQYLKVFLVYRNNGAILHSLTAVNTHPVDIYEYANFGVLYSGSIFILNVAVLLPLSVEIFTSLNHWPDFPLGNT